MSEDRWTWPAERVVTAARDGDDDALEQLLAGSHPHVQRFARTLCSSPQDAEDAAQEALIVLYRQIGSLRATAALGGWLFRIVRHECIRRARMGRRPIFRPTLDDAPSAEFVLLERLETERVVAAIASLPAEQRAVLVLRDVQGRSGAATAETLGISRAAMKSRLHSGRAAVRAQLDEPAPALRRQPEASAALPSERSALAD